MEQDWMFQTAILRAASAKFVSPSAWFSSHILLFRSLTERRLLWRFQCRDGERSAEARRPAF